MADPFLGLAGIVITSTFLVVGDDMMKFKALSSGCLSMIFAVYFAAAGQVHAEIVTFYGNLDSAQVVDAASNHTSNSTATGEVAVTIDTTLQTLKTDLVWRGLSGPSAFSHVHAAPEGVNYKNAINQFFHEIISDAPTPDLGYIDCPFNPALYCVPATGELHNSLDLSDGSHFDPTGQDGFRDFWALLGALESGGLYVDMHTEVFPGGEIRGQLLNQSVPEPSTLYLLGLGVCASMWGSYKRFAPALRA